MAKKSTNIQTVHPDFVTDSSAPVSATTSQEKEVVNRDEFANPEYIDPLARLPRIQALRGTSPQLCGYFIAIEQMVKAGWLDYNEDNLITYTYESSGNQEKGLLIQHPRMLVCPKTPILAYDRYASQEEQKPVLLGTYASLHKDDDNVGNLQYYEVILLDAKNKPLHQVPLSYAAKGANGASFSIEWQRFIDEMTQCHALTNRIPARPKNNKFKALCAFSFKTSRVLVGNKQKSFACRVVEHDAPTIRTWKDYFVGFDEMLKQAIWDGLQPSMPLMVPGAPEKEVPLLPEATQPNR